MDNSGIRQSLSYSYIVSARNEGAYTIGSAKIEVDGQTYTTKPFQITVTKTSARPKDPNDPYSIAARNAFLKVQASRTSVYVGEPIVASYKIYFKMNISQPELLKEPSYTGFYKENITAKRATTSEERYRDETYQTYKAMEMLLIPQKAGDLKPGTVEMKIPTQIPTRRRDFFGRQLTQTVNQTATTDFPTLRVRALPTKGKPDDFAGAVGSYKMDVSISRNELSANESVTLKVKISGNGNIKLVELPKPEMPNAFEVYDPKYSEKISVNANGMSGSKTYEYLLIPRYGGTYKIPAVKFSYFDTRAKEYRTISSETFEITVTGGGAQPSPQQSGNPINNSSQEEVSFLNKDILYIKTKAGDLEIKRSVFFKSSLFYTVLTILLGLSLGLVVYNLILSNQKKDSAKLKQGRANKMARKHLAAAKNKLDSGAKDEFYQALSAALLGYFSYKMNIPNSKMSKDFIEESLQQRNVDEAIIRQAIDMMNRAELARFTSASSDPNRDYEETARVITEIEKQLV